MLFSLLVGSKSLVLSDTTPPRSPPGLLGGRQLNDHDALTLGMRRGPNQGPGKLLIDRLPPHTCSKHGGGPRWPSSAQMAPSSTESPSSYSKSRSAAVVAARWVKTAARSLLIGHNCCGLTPGDLPGLVDFTVPISFKDLLVDSKPILHAGQRSGQLDVFGLLQMSPPPLRSWGSGSAPLAYQHRSCPPWSSTC